MRCPDCGGKKYRRNPDLRTRMQLGELPEDYVRRAATLGDARARGCWGWAPLRSGTHLKPWPVDMRLPKSIPPSARYFRSLLVGLPSDLVVSFAVDVTERVLPIYEHDSPSDYGYRQRVLMTEAIEAARRWVKDPCCTSDRPIHSARCPRSPNRLGDRGTKSWHYRGTTLLLAPGSPIMWRSPSYAAVAAAYAAHAVPQRGPARADGLLLPDRTEIAWQKQRLIEYLLGEVQVHLCHCPALDLFRYGCKCGGRRRRRLRRNTDRREGGLPGFNKWVEPRLKPRESGVTYWGDLSKAEQAAFKQQYAAEIDELFEMEYPFKAKFINEDVMVLGPQSTFLPEPDGSIRKTQWVRAKRPDGSTFATLASSIFVNGSPLITKSPPGRVAKTRPLGFGSDLGLLRKEYERLKWIRKN